MQRMFTLLVDAYSVMPAELCNLSFHCLMHISVAD